VVRVGDVWVVWIGKDLEVCGVVRLAPLTKDGAHTQIGYVQCLALGQEYV
jgi:hypothetical protein